MARKYSKHGPFEDLRGEAEGPAAIAPGWLCGRPLGTAVVWHHPVPKSRGRRGVVPMHPICQQTLVAHFTNSELQRHALDVDALLTDPNVRNFSAGWPTEDPDFNAARPGSSAEPEEASPAPPRISPDERGNRPHLTR